MRTHCLIPGFRIDRETVCNASGSHPLCRKCLSPGADEPGDLLYGGNSYLIDPEEERQIQTPRLPAIKGKVRKRCKCGQAFFPKCNRQRLCSRCGKVGERRRKAQWARKTEKIGS